jgi:hypothetical protein
MLFMLKSIARSLLILSLSFAAAHAQPRPPAVPLVVHNPYFSIWSTTDHLTDGPTRHWTGAEQPLTGLIRIDGVPYRYMGGSPRRIPALPQTSLEITATHTRYQFEGAGIRLRLSFFTPAFPQDLDLLSRPVSGISPGASPAPTPKPTRSSCCSMSIHASP